jgi:hypothetical protein
LSDQELAKMQQQLETYADYMSMVSTVTKAMHDSNKGIVANFR